MRKDRVYIDNRLFYLACDNNHCGQLESVGSSQTKRHLKTRKDLKRHEKKRKIHDKMRKDRVYNDNRLFYLARNNNHCCQLESVGRKSEPKVRLKPF